MTFRDLHAPGKPFILANAWDAGSAKMLAAMGAPAIATSSAAHAFTLGRPDGGSVSRDEALSHASDLMAAVNMPVSGDFENGFGHSPDDCAETVRLSAEIGLAGISIEDAALPEDHAYDFDEAVERIRAASAAARALPRDFVLVARADGVMNGHYDIEEALRRVRAFDEAGADCLYVPMPKTMDDLKRVIAATAKPVNVLVAGPYSKVPLTDYAKMGAARLSLGSALARVTHRIIHDTSRAMFDQGDFSPLSQTMAGDVVDRMLSD
ncbi:MAG: isocitrate lyase/phosphoenolpyruvate mutase family protein [Silicimonas sp.]|nr:isocitrate lyase/phosphoenolpyruvate mutase family protein [Silicimonas sp.]